MNIDLCTNCKKRNDCKELCLKAEEYVNQDYVPLRERLLLQSTDNMPDDTERWFNIPEKSILTKREYQLLHALIEGKTRTEAAQLLGITKETVRSMLRNIRKKRAKFSLNMEGELCLTD